MHPSRAKGKRHELATVAALTELLAGTGLTVEKTRAGYERDGGDLHILTPDRTVLFVIQCKDVAVKDWRFPEWLRDLAGQCATSHAARGFLSVKRPRVLDAAQAYAVCDLAAMAALVRELYGLHTIIASHDGPGHDTELAALDAENLRLREQAGRMAEEIERLRAELSAVPFGALVAARSAPSKSIMDGDGPDPDVLPDPPGTVRGRQVYPWRQPHDPVSP
jgi:hypothetical protein